jgi:hypothetical protein
MPEKRGMTNGELTRLSVCSLAQPALALLDTSIHLENSMHSRFTWRYLRHLAAASFIAALGACGGGENPDIAPTGAPAITAQPQAAAVTVGETAKFSVTVTGAEPLKYQWRRNGQPISGADQSRYNTAPTAPQRRRGPLLGGDHQTLKAASRASQHCSR